MAECDICPTEAHILRAKLMKQRRAGQDGGGCAPPTPPVWSATWLAGSGVPGTERVSPRSQRCVGPGGIVASACWIAEAGAGVL